MEQVPPLRMTKLPLPTKLHEQLKARRMRACKPIPFPSDILKQRKQDHSRKSLVLDSLRLRSQSLPQPTQRMPIVLSSTQSKRRRIDIVGQCHQRRRINGMAQTASRQTVRLIISTESIQRRQEGQMAYCLIIVFCDRGILVEEIADSALLPGRVGDMIQA
jgi:hypothetical protein